MVKFCLLPTLPFIYTLQNNANHKCELHMVGYFKFSSSHMKSVKRDRFLEKCYHEILLPIMPCLIYLHSQKIIFIFSYWPQVSLAKD